MKMPSLYDAFVYYLYFALAHVVVKIAYYLYRTYMRRQVK